MEREESKVINPNLAEKSKRKPSIKEIKEKLGLDKIPVIHPHIPVKKDGKHLYQVAGFIYPLRPETIERLNIPNQRILFEVDREEWLNERREARDEHGDTPEHDDNWWGG